MDLHANGLPFGTMRRSPSGEGFAHVVLCDQSRGAPPWCVVDIFGGLGEMMTDDEVADWPIVYRPAGTADWRDRTFVSVATAEVPEVNRIEVVSDIGGREFMTWSATKTKISVQDEGRTIKIFFTYDGT